MLKIPISNIKLDLEYPELNEKYLRYLNIIDIDTLYFINDINELREISSGLTFKIIYNEEINKCLYYNEELSIYFISNSNLELTNPRLAYYQVSVNQNKYHELFKILREIADEDKSLIAKMNLIKLQNKESQL